jgi:O-antigen/teichoic acid export membrane protein
MSLEALQSLHTLALGFAIAGLLASFYELVTERPPSFTLLTGRAEPSAILAVLFLLLAAPFIIMRNTIRGVEYEHRNVGFVMIATVIAGLWSLASGALVVKTIETLLIAA